MPRQRLEGFGLTGLNSDTIPTLLPVGALTTAKNVQPEGGAIRSVYGEYKLFNVPIRPFYHYSFLDQKAPGDDLQWVVYSDSESVMATNMKTGVHTNITPDTGVFSGKGYVTFTYLQGALVVNSSTNGPYYWDQYGTGKLVPLPGWPPGQLCLQIIAYRNFLVALRTGNVDPNNNNQFNWWNHKIAWSNSVGTGDVPLQWEPAADNDAGDAVLGETPGEIKGGCLVGDKLWIVKEDDIFEVAWIGGDYVMRTRRLYGANGTRMLRGFAEYRGNMIIFNSRDLVIFDGHNSRSLVDQRIRRELFSKVYGPYWFASQVHVHFPSSQLFVVVASEGNDQTGTEEINVLRSCYVYNFETGVWTSRELNYSYGFDNAIASIPTPQVTTQQQQTFSVNPDNYDAEWSGGVMSFDQDDQPFDTDNPGGDPPGNGDPPPPPGGDPGHGDFGKGLSDNSVQEMLVWESTPDDTAWWVSALTYTNTYSDGRRKHCVAQRIGIPIEGSPGMAQVTRAWLELQGTAEVRVVWGSQDQPRGTVTWGNNDAQHQVLLASGAEQIEITPRVTGRYLAFHIESTDVGYWSLGGITVHWEKAGER